MKYVVLLRGVNVGGQNRVPQYDFRTVLQQCGFSEIQIYINSGNAIVSSTEAPDLVTTQTALEEYFGFSVLILIIPRDKFLKIANSIPHDWTNDSPKPDKSGQKSDVLFLFDEINSPDVIEKIGHKSDIETMIYIDGAVITNVSRANQAKGSLQKLVNNKALYNKITVRNINTVKKLVNIISS
ncbi:MAG: DUF1697 domain-containing protein [Candidatus Saccharimonadales bacterium]